MPAPSGHRRHRAARQHGHRRTAHRREPSPGLPLRADHPEPANLRPATGHNSMARSHADSAGIWVLWPVGACFVRHGGSFPAWPRGNGMAEAGQRVPTAAGLRAAGRRACRCDSAGSGVQARRLAGLRRPVGSDRGALSGLLLVGFPGPPAAPGVRLSPHRALRVSCPLGQLDAAGAQGVGMVLPR